MAKINDSSSTAQQFSFTPTPDSSIPTLQDKFSAYEMLTVANQNDIRELKKDIKKVEVQCQENKKFYASITKLSDHANRIIWALVLIPIIQVIFCVGAIYAFHLEDKLIPLFNWVIGGIGLGSFVEIIGYFSLIIHMNKKIETLSEKVDKLSEKKK